MTTSEEQQQHQAGGKPKRPLSAYNLFFQNERVKILKEKGENSIGFGNLTRTIAERWKDIDDEVREQYEDEAMEQKQRYKQQKKEWKKMQGKRKGSNKQQQQTTTQQQQQQQEQDDDGIENGSNNANDAIAIEGLDPQQRYEMMQQQRVVAESDAVNDFKKIASLGAAFGGEKSKYNLSAMNPTALQQVGSGGVGSFLQAEKNPILSQLASELDVIIFQAMHQCSNVGGGGSGSGADAVAAAGKNMLPFLQGAATPGAVSLAGMPPSAAAAFPPAAAAALPPGIPPDFARSNPFLGAALAAPSSAAQRAGLGGMNFPGLQPNPMQAVVLGNMAANHQSKLANLVKHQNALKAASILSSSHQCDNNEIISDDDRSSAGVGLQEEQRSIICRLAQELQGCKHLTSKTKFLEAGAVPPKKRLKIVSDEDASESSSKGSSTNAAKQQQQQQQNKQQFLTRSSPMMTSIAAGGGSSHHQQQPTSPSPKIEAGGVVDGRKQRTMSAYNLFFKEERDKVIAELGEDSFKGKFGQLVRLIAERWKNLSPEVRNHYQKLALQMKDENTTTVASAAAAQHNNSNNNDNGKNNNAEASSSLSILSAAANQVNDGEQNEQQKKRNISEINIIDNNNEMDNDAVDVLMGLQKKKKILANFAPFNTKIRGDINNSNSNIEELNDPGADDPSGLKAKGLKWDRMFQRLYAFYQEQGHCAVPRKYERDHKLGKWVSKHKKYYNEYMNNGNIDPEFSSQKAYRLAKIDFDIQSNQKRESDKWELQYEKLLDFAFKHAHPMVPRNKNSDYAQLANWVSNQRREYQKIKKGRPSRLNKVRLHLLNGIDFVWEPTIQGLSAITMQFETSPHKEKYRMKAVQLLRKLRISLCEGGSSVSKSESDGSQEEEEDDEQSNGNENDEEQSENDNESAAPVSGGIPSQEDMLRAMSAAGAAGAALPSFLPPGFGQSPFLSPHPALFNMPSAAMNPHAAAAAAAAAARLGQMQQQIPPSFFMQPHMSAAGQMLGGGFPATSHHLSQMGNAELLAEMERRGG